MDPVSQAFIGDRSGVFRGIEFDVSIEEVKEAEYGELLDEDNDFLHYIDRPEGASTNDFLDIQYFFNGAGELDMITAFYSLNNLEMIQTIEKDVYEYFTRKYGRSQSDEIGWHVWEYNTRRGQAGVVELSMKVNVEDGFRGIELEAVKYIKLQ
ncbi:MAG: hypothetical protein EA412_11425 [Chitinophagaceae bacterium]|nr:MAG: hypothetical protein EA412_11425 [Chitinophagaceae bacterium]